jgi:chromosome segregation ATPase
VAASPAAPPPTSDELEELKRELAECDAHIDELKKQREENSKLLEKLVPTPPPSARSGAMDIDDLIAKYKALVLERHAEIDELEKEVHEQEIELARLGARQESLDSIEAAVSELEKDVEEAKQKRDELEKKDKLDPELRAILDAIIRDVQKVREKIDELLALQAKAKADKEEMEKKVQRAAEAARKEAKEEGKDPDEAATLATQAAEKEAQDASRAADLKTMQAAQEMKKD